VGYGENFIRKSKSMRTLLNIKFWSIHSGYLAILIFCGVCHGGTFESLSARWTGVIKITGLKPSTVGIEKIWDDDKVYGLIDANGRLQFSLDNGCQLTGNITSTKNREKYGLSINISDCHIRQINAAYTGLIILNGHHAVISATQSGLSIISTESIFLNVTLAKY
jgi:hypothetical protein